MKDNSIPSLETEIQILIITKRETSYLDALLKAIEATLQNSDREYSLVEKEYRLKSTVDGKKVSLKVILQS